MREFASLSFVALFVFPSFASSQSCADQLNDQSTPSQLIQCLKEQSQILGELSATSAQKHPLVSQSISANCNQTQTVTLAQVDNVIGCWLSDISVYRHGGNMGELRCAIEQNGRSFELKAIGDDRFCSPNGAISIRCSATCR